MEISYSAAKQQDEGVVWSTLVENGVEQTETRKEAIHQIFVAAAVVTVVVATEQVSSVLEEVCSR